MEEVVIQVKQESQGNALSEASARIEQLKARIAELNNLEKNYASKGITGTADLSKERTALQRELGGLVKDQNEQKKRASDSERRDGRERLTHEREITGEARRREAVRSARARALGRGVDAFEGQSGMGGGLGNMAGLLANPLTAVAVAIGAYVGKAVSQAAEKLAAVRESQEKAGFAAGRRRRIMGRSDPLQGEGEASGEVSANVAALEAAEDRKGKFQDTEPVRDFVRGVFGFETSGRKKERENDLDISRLKQNLPGDAALAESKFRSGTGGAELEARKAGLAYDMQGKRFADDKVAAMKEYHRVLQAVGGEHATAEGKALAAEAATDAVRERQRERAGNVAGLVNARTGTRGTAQIARIAAGFDNPGRAREVVDAISGLHGTVKASSQPPLRDWEERFPRR